MQAPELSAEVSNPEPPRHGQRRIAISFWEGYLGVAPSLLSAVAALVADGYSVELVMRDRPEFQPPPSLHPDHVRVTVLRPLVPARTGVFRRHLARVGDSFDRLRFIRLCLDRARRERFIAWIGVDVMGMVAAGAAAGPGVPVLHWSLELEPAARSRNPVRRWLSRRARRYQRQAAVTIIQDDVRAAALRQVLGGPIGGTLRIVPNAPAGDAIDAPAALFHERFGLARSQRVILHAGWIAPQHLAEELAQAAASWPDDWTLVLHERAPRRDDDPFLRRVVTLGQGRIRLSLDPVPYDELDALFASAHVCLALYSADMGDNVRLIGSASGKVAHALKVGVPIVCTDSPGLAELVRETGCGIVVRSTEEIADAIRRISADYEGFRARAWSCYRDRLEFGAAFARVLKDLEALAR